jgi:hypothetical protein
VKFGQDAWGIIAQFLIIILGKRRNFIPVTSLRSVQQQIHSFATPIDLCYYSSMDFMQLAEQRKELQKQYVKGSKYAANELSDIKKRVTASPSSSYDFLKKSVRKQTK